MIKRLIPMATLLAFALPWLGCNKSGKLDQPSSYKTPEGPVELKLKWPAGERIVQEMLMKQKSTISVPSQATPMQQDMSMRQDYALTVLKANPDGGHELEMEYLNARMKMEMGGKTMMDYDSAKKAADAKADPTVGNILANIVGAKVRFFLDATNEVARAEGVDDLLKRIESSGAAGAGAATALKSMFSEDYFKQLMGQNRFLPAKPVKPGDTWVVTTEFPMAGMGTMVLDYNFTFQSWEMHGKRNCARLEFDGAIKSKPDANPSPTGMAISGLDGSTSGTSWFDPDLGIVIDSSINQDINMVMNMPSGRAGSTMTMTNQMNQIITVKLLSVK